MKTPRKILISLRKQKSKKQKDIAEAIGITTSYYGMIEVGDRTPSLKYAKAIADYFDTQVEEIFFDGKNNKTLSNELLNERNKKPLVSR